MKTIIYLLFMTYFFMSDLRAEDFVHFENEGPKFTVTFEIGKIPNCAWGFGICKITIGAPELTKEGISGFIEYNTKGSGSGGGGGGSWILGFPRESFAKNYPDFLSNLDGKSTVSFEESYTLSPEVRDALGATQDLMIKEKTLYPIVFVDGNYIITFR